MAMVGLVVGGQRLKVEEPAANGMPHLEDRKPAGLRVSVEREPLILSFLFSLCYSTVRLCARVSVCGLLNQPNDCTRLPTLLRFYLVLFPLVFPLQLPAPPAAPHPLLSLPAPSLDMVCR